MPQSTCRALLFAVALFLPFLPVQSVHAQPGSTVDFHIPRISVAPVIDGEVGSAEWGQATRVVLGLETSPSDNIPASVQTEAFIMEDGEYLYVAFIATDPNPEQIRTFYRDRDSIGGGDYVGVLLDTFNDEARSFEFITTPLGVQFDAATDDLSGSYDESWNALWDSEGSLTATGYMTEMAIPFKQLRFEGGAGEKIWGVKFIRDYPRDRRYRFTDSEQDRNISCTVCQFRKASGFANVVPGRNLEIIPTLTASAAQRRPNPALDSWSSTETDPDAGVDLRWGINQDTYLNATLNPDFSQVEADSAQLEINNTFSLFFPEKRTFFLDGADYFNSQLNIVHTRNIADPDYGVKLTGKSGRHSYGLLQANDTSTSFMIPTNDSSSVASLGQSDSDVSILRYRQEVLTNSSIGTVLTHRNGDGYSNTVAGADARWRLSGSDVINLQVLRSQSDYPLAIQTRYRQDDSISDETYLIEYRHNDRRWDVWAEHVDFGKDFRADLGFINRVDYTRNTLRVGHTWRYEAGTFFDRIRVALDWDNTHDQAGLELEEEFEVFLEMNGPLQSQINGLFGGSKTYYNGFYFDEQFNQLSVSARPNSELFLQMLVRIEDIVDFANTRLGESKRYSPTVNYQMGQHLQMNLQYTHQTFDVKGGRLFTANLVNLRATYQFNVRSFLRFIVQYSDNERDRALYINPVQSQSKELTTQLLYSYKLTPQTLFFIGYSDAGFQNDSLNSIETSNRTIFAKFSYAWQP
ncbi:MAG: DUF5916 domain-containing protein [Gammaproteobacteria bacterium]|nr:DUF5916 domain-containing protein [Gammaproteobacteria bacterium]